MRRHLTKCHGGYNYRQKKHTQARGGRETQAVEDVDYDERINFHTWIGTIDSRSRRKKGRKTIAES